MLGGLELLCPTDLKEGICMLSLLFIMDYIAYYYYKAYCKNIIV